MRIDSNNQNKKKKNTPQAKLFRSVRVGLETEKNFFSGARVQDGQPTGPMGRCPGAGERFLWCRGFFGLVAIITSYITLGDLSRSWVPGSRMLKDFCQCLRVFCFFPLWE